MNCKTVISLFIILFLSSCSNSSLEDYREEAAGISRSLLKEMQSIHSRDDLQAHTPKLKKLFSRLVDVIIAAHEMKTRLGSEIPPFSIEDQSLSDALRAELTRLYSIEGARDLIEKAQQESLYRLDAYLQKNALT